MRHNRTFTHSLTHSLTLTHTHSHSLTLTHYIVIQGYYLLWQKKRFGDIPLPLALKVTKIVSDVSTFSVRSVVMTALYSKKADKSGGDVLFYSAQKNKLLGNYSSLDILYVTLIAINGEEIADILAGNGVSKADQLVGNTHAVNAVACHLDKLMDGNDASFTFYKEIKESMFALTRVVPEVDGVADDEKHGGMYGTKNGESSESAEITVHSDDDCGYDCIYGRETASTAVHNPLRSAVTVDVTASDAVSRDRRESCSEKH